MATSNWKSLAAAPVAAAFGIVEAPFHAVQRAFGVRPMPWLFLTPNLVIFGVFTFLPLIINFYYAFTGGVELYPSERPFTGMENLATLFECGNHFDPSTCRKDLFWRAIWNTAQFALLQVTLMVLFSVITALVLNRKVIGRGFWRGVYFYPVLLSPVVVALIWKWILQQDGVLNAIILGAGGTKVPFLLDPGWAFFWVIFVSIWAHMGFYTLILLAGLQAIPGDLYEAATMDGTSKMRAFWRITLPLLTPNLLVVLVLALIRAVQAFDEIYVLTGGGPGTATQFIVQYIYETAFASNVHILGLAAAASILIGIVLLALTLLQLRLSYHGKS